MSSIRHRLSYSTLSPFAAIPYFTINGFRQVAGLESADERRAQIALHRWVKAGHVIRLKKGMYMTRQFYGAHRNDPQFSSAVAAIIQPQSYVSLETILQRHGILTEVTFPITAITIKHTRTVENNLATFLYKHIRPDLYCGFSINNYFGVSFSEASLAKALFDYFYFQPLAAISRTSSFNPAEHLRLNLDEFPAADREQFAGFVEEFGVTKLMNILKKLRKTVWRP